MKRKEAEDAKRDVTKQNDLSGFYSNLLHGTLAGDIKADSSRDAAFAKGADCSGAAAPATAASVGLAAGVDEETDPEASAEEASDTEMSTKLDAKRKGGAGGEGSVSLVEPSLESAIAEATKTKLPEKRSVALASVATVSHERRNDGEAVQSARERYLERKRQKLGEGGS